MARILITGGAGFIGYHLAEKLSTDSSSSITIADNLQRGQYDNKFKKLIEKPNITFKEVNLTDINTTRAIWDCYDEVYHLAAMIGVKHCVNDPKNVLYTNIMSTSNIIRLIIENRCKKVLFSSTCETYASGFGLGVVNVPTDESVPLVIGDVKSPRLSYAGSKIVGEQLIHFNSSGNYQYSIIRYHNIFGPRMGYAHVIPEVVKRIYQKESPFKIYGASQTRAFCYVADAVAQTIAVMKSDKTNGEIIHIGNNREEIAIKDLIEKIFKILDYHPSTINVEGYPGSVERRCPDISKLERLTGVRPRVPLDEALKITVEWYWDDINKNGVWE